jgi:hypothetical protein
MKHGHNSAAQRVEAEDLAASALGFLAADGERINRFLSLSGIDPSGIRAAASAPGFLIGVLDHLLGDEALLLEFAQNAGCRPEGVAAARAALAGPEPWRE